MCIIMEIRANKHDICIYILRIKSFASNTSAS